jgi:ubiquinone/menaquinone biosynthesis C-methylase UbiE
MRALNLGCGTKLKLPGEDGYSEWINADVRGDVGADTVCDFTIGLPFPSEYFDHVLADNVLEHFRSEDSIALINEIDRVLVSAGTLLVIVPHFGSQGAVQDPTHKSFWAPRTFLYLNQCQTPFGGRSIGITANFVAIEGPTISGDMDTEAFIRCMLRKEPTA